MSEVTGVKKPIQDIIEFQGKEYTVQKLPALEAFLLREDLDLGRLYVHLIDETIVHPNVKAEDLEHPNDIRELGTILLTYHFGRNDEYKEVGKLLNEG